MGHTKAHIAGKIKFLLARFKNENQQSDSAKRKKQKQKRKSW